MQRQAPVALSVRSEEEAVHKRWEGIDLGFPCGTRWGGSSSPTNCSPNRVTDPSSADAEEGEREAGNPASAVFWAGKCVSIAYDGVGHSAARAWRWLLVRGLLEPWLER